MNWKVLEIFVLSVVAFVTAVRFPMNWLDRWPRLWLRLACLFAILPHLPFVGSQMRSAHRWLSFPGNVNVPSHYLVLTLFMAGAAALSAIPAMNKFHKAETLVLTYVTWFALLLQPHFWGASALLGLVLIAMTIQGRWKSALFLCAIPITAITAYFVSNPWLIDRVFYFLDPASDLYAKGYQLVNNLSTIATAQWFGPSAGFALSYQAAIHSDLAMIAGHYGLVAASLFIVVPACAMAVAVWHAPRQPDPRMRTLGLLMSFALGCWVWYAVAWPLALVPTSNVSLPFAGSIFASVFAALALGFVYRVAKAAALAPTLPPTRSARISIAVIAGCTGLLLATMWTLKPPFNYPSIQRGQILDAQGIALTERWQAKQKYSLRYPYGSTLAQVLGVIGHGGMGIEGLQLQYERTLSGTVEDPGKDLRLTIDLRNQLALEAVLQPFMEHRAESIEVIVMKPDGTILATASLPSYDPNQRSQMAFSRMRFRPATDTAEAGPMMSPFYLAYGMETLDVRARDIPSDSAALVAKLRTEDLRAALMRFEFNKPTGLDFPGTRFGVFYGGLGDQMRKPISSQDEQKIRLELSEGWGVAPSLIRYAVSFTGLVTGTLPQARLVFNPQEVSPPHSPVVKLETAAAIRAMMVAAAQRAGSENVGAVWTSFRPEISRVKGLDTHHAMAALFAPANRPQRMVIVKITALQPLPNDIGIEIGTKVLGAVQ